MDVTALTTSGWITVTVTATDKGLDDWNAWMASTRARHLYTRWRKLWDDQREKFQHITNTEDQMASMVKEWKIEIRTNFADPGKNAVFKKTVQSIAVRLHANATLLADGVKPRMAIQSDDFFYGQEQIEMFDDVIKQGTDELSAITGVEEGDNPEPVSQELLDAVRARK